MMPEEDRATDSMHKTFGIDCACDSRDIIVDKHIHTHTHILLSLLVLRSDSNHNTPQPLPRAN